LLSENANIFGLVKFIMLKLVVVIMVIENLVAEFMIQSDRVPYNDDSKWSSEEKIKRGYCKTFLVSLIFYVFLLGFRVSSSFLCFQGILVLLEFVILCLPYFIAFAYRIKLSPYKPVNRSSITVDELSTSLSPLSFLIQLFQWTDVFGSMAYDPTVVGIVRNETKMTDLTAVEKAEYGATEPETTDKLPVTQAEEKGDEEKGVEMSNKGFIRVSSSDDKTSPSSKKQSVFLRSSSEVEV
jgi:hypothetical protein